MKKKAQGQNGQGITDQQLRELRAEVERARAEAAEKAEVEWAEVRASLKEMAEAQKEAARWRAYADKQIGDLGNKFGTFTEGMAFPSVTRLLDEHFGMRKAQLRVRSRLNGRTLELDIFGYNDEAACVVEVKSHLRESGVRQLLDTLREFSHFFPEHANKRLYGMIAAVDIPESLKERVQKLGIYLARVQDETFEVDELFPLARARDFSRPRKSPGATDRRS